MISSELATCIVEMALTEPYRQIEPMTTAKFREWLWKLDIKFMDWQTLHYLWMNGVVIPVGVTQRALDETPKLDHGRFIPVVKIDGVQIFGDLGVRNVDLPALDVGREDFRGLAESLWWHPFQLYEFYGVEWAIQQNWTLDTYLREADANFAEWTNFYRTQHRMSLSAGANEPKHAEFRRLLALLLTVEPCVHGYIHGSIRYGVNQSYEGYHQWRKDLLGEKLLERVGLTLDDAIAWHEELSSKAHLQDPLRGIRTLVNQIDPKRRAKTHGNVLRSNVMYSQAESLRRHLEWSYDLTLLEEDDYQMREIHLRFKENAFGNRRVLDRQRDVLRRVARYYGLDPQTRVVLLLEGKTETGFLDQLAKNWEIDLQNRGIDMIDLEGKDKLGTSKILIQQLERYQRDEIFAYAALDKDTGDRHLATLKKFGKSGQLSAGFTVWNPDFEECNFSIAQLARVATIMAESQGTNVKFLSDDVEQYMTNNHLPAGKALERLASKVGVQLSKGDTWGRTLANLACDPDVNVPESLLDEQGQRPATSILGMLIRGVNANYDLSVERTKSKYS